MSSVQNWAAALCVAAFASALLQYLSPGGTMEKVFRLVLGAFVLCGLLSPLTDVLPTIAESLPAWSESSPQSEFTQSVDDQILQSAKANLEQVIAGQLYTMGYSWENIEIFMDMAADGSIVINKVAVTLSDPVADCTEVSGRLEKVTGLKMEVTAYGG